MFIHFFDDMHLHKIHHSKTMTEETKKQGNQHYNVAAGRA